MSQYLQVECFFLGFMCHRFKFVYIEQATDKKYYFLHSLFLDGQIWCCRYYETPISAIPSQTQQSAAGLREEEAASCLVGDTHLACQTIPHGRVMGIQDPHASKRPWRSCGISRFSSTVFTHCKISVAIYDLYLINLLFSAFHILL